jgi:hypothetical protein
MSESLPMKSAKIRQGQYAVLGTSTECIVTWRQWVSITKWDLTSNGEHVRSFDTKREALIYCQDHPEL